MTSGTIHSILPVRRRRPKALLRHVAAAAGLFVVLFALFSYSAESRILSRQLQILSDDAPTPSSESLSSLSTSLANHTGHWIGNSWIPPQGWTTFSAQDLRQLYTTTSVLWIGDSTARRAGATFYAILNGTEEDPAVEALDRPSVIDVNIKVVTQVCSDPRFVDQWRSLEICRQMPSSGDFVLVSEKCPRGLDQFVKSELSRHSTILNHVDVMVVSLGIWEGVRPWNCREKNRTQWDVLNDTIEAVETLARTRDIKIIWRTSGFSFVAADDVFEGNVLMSKMNDHIMARLDEFAAERKQANVPNNLFYVNWGGTMSSRSFGNNRIHGDIKAHYGLEARHALIQMLTNVMYERSNVLASDAITHR